MRTPSSLSSAQSPVRIRKADTASKWSGTQSLTTTPTKTPTCKGKRKGDHSPALASGCETGNWETFPWHVLNTLPRKIESVELRTISSIRNACTRKLGRLDRAAHKTANLKLIISGIRTTISQKWETLLVYFNEECKFPRLERPWSHKEWRKWDVVDFLTRIAVSYNEGCERAASEGAVLDTAEVDKMVFALLNDLHDLGEDAKESTIVIKEWERPGTMWFMQLEEVSYSLTGYGYGDSQE